MKRILTTLALALIWTNTAAADGAFGGSGGPPPRLYSTQEAAGLFPIILIESAEYERLSALVKENGNSLATEIYGQSLTVIWVEGNLFTAEEVPRQIVGVPN